MSRFILRRARREWVFELVDDAGETLLKSGPHATRLFALAAIEEVRQITRRESAFECCQTEKQRHYFNLISSDHRRVAVSGYIATSEQLYGVLAACRATAHVAPIVEEIGDD